MWIRFWAKLVQETMKAIRRKQDLLLILAATTVDDENAEG